MNLLGVRFLLFHQYIYSDIVLVSIAHPLYLILRYTMQSSPADFITLYKSVSKP